MNKIIQGDCIEELGKMATGTFDLAVNDPPYNISYSYDLYEDDKSDEEYLRWCRGWLFQIHRTLKANGTFWLAIGDAFASDLDVFCRRVLGFHRRSWVLWHFTFGVNCTKKFTPSHTHLFHYVKDPNNFTFNADAIKVPSARQRIYGDKRAKNGGRLPDDLWVLRPQEAENGEFAPAGSVWFEPRVCGTHKERVGHPAQMPLEILRRIIRVSSNLGDLILDPMAGSGVTCVAAKELGRNYCGIELSPNYVKVIEERLAGIGTAA